MLGTIFSVAAGVVLGGVILSWMQAKRQAKINRFTQYWETNYSTPFHVYTFNSAKDSLLDKYGEKYIDKVIAWAELHQLIVSPEQRLAKLDLLFAKDTSHDEEIRRYGDVSRHWAVRQWATDCGLSAAFERWENECNEKLNAPAYQE